MPSWVDARSQRRDGRLAAHTKIQVTTLHQMFGPHGNPTARNLFEIVAFLKRREGLASKSDPHAPLPREAAAALSGNKTHCFCLLESSKQTSITLLVHLINHNNVRCCNSPHEKKVLPQSEIEMGLDL